MSNLPSPTFNTRARFSREGFQPIPNQSEGRMAGRDNDNYNNDATIDIPLEQVQSNGQGLRSQSSTFPLNKSTSPSTEKKSFFHGRRHKPDNQTARKTGNVGYDGEEDTINIMGRIYKKILNFSFFTRYLLYVLPIAAIIAVPIIVGALVDEKAKVGIVPIEYFFTWIEIVWLSLWVSKTVAHYLPFLFQIFAGVVSSGVRKYSMVLRSLEIPLSLVGWAVASLATFRPVMTKNPYNSNECALKTTPNTKTYSSTYSCWPHWMSVMESILAAAVCASLIFLGEKFFIQLISINYHRKQFSSRIKDSKHRIHLLGLLYEASRTLFPPYGHEFAEEDYIIADQLGIRKSKGPSHARSGSATPMRIIQNVGRVGDKITSAFGNVAHEITGRDVFNPDSAHSIVVEALEKKHTSEALARRIWMSFVIEGRDSLLQEDIVDVLGPDRKEEAEEAFWTLDRDGNGDISLDEMVLTVAEFSRERKAISSSMHDVDQAINVLDNLLAVVAFIVIVLVFVAFLEKGFTSTLATTGTALLSLSFIFSVTCQEVLGSCVFLFVKHPYDIGDLVYIGNSGATNQDAYIVEHISLLFTNFRRVQGANVGRLSQIPNIVLNTLWIENVTRSKAMSEQILISISFDTTFDDLQILKNELTTFVADKDNSRDFQPTIELDILGTSDQSSLSLCVEVKHKSNWSNESIRRARRSKFVCALVSAMKAVPIYPPGGGADLPGSAANPNYNVSITETDAKEHAEATAQDRESARLIPKKKLDKIPQLNPVDTSGTNPGAGLTPRQNQVVEILTARPDPGADPARDEAWTSSRDDSSTLGDHRPSVDRADLDEVRGLLRRESTRGKRKAAPDYTGPAIPTINEPGYEQPPYRYGAYSATQQPLQQTFSAPAAPYAPPASKYRVQAGPQLPMPVTGGPAIEMAQVSSTSPPARQPSNPYRQRSESVSRKPLSPPRERDREDDAEEGEDENLRPYSGV